MVCNCETFRAYIVSILVNDSKKIMDSLVNLSTTVKSLCCYAYHHHDTSQVSHYNPGVLVRCINLCDVRLLFRPYAMQFGELREVRESSSSYYPRLGPRFSSLDKYNIDVAHRESEHCSQYNNSCLTTNTCTICDYTVQTATVIIIDNVTLYTQDIIISLIRNVYL